MKKPKKSHRTPLHLKNFGCVEEIRLGDHTHVRINMGELEIRRLTEALGLYVLRKQKIPNPKVLDALDRIREFFNYRGHTDLVVTADVVMGGVGMAYRPAHLPLSEVIPGFEDSDKEPRRRRKK